VGGATFSPPEVLQYLNNWLRYMNCYVFPAISFVKQRSTAAPNPSGTSVKHYRLFRRIGPLEGIPERGIILRNACASFCVTHSRCVFRHAD